MLQEALAMGAGHLAEEMREVEDELEEDSSKHDAQNPRGSIIPLEAVEEGHADGSAMRISRPSSPRGFRSGSPRRMSGSPRR